VLATTSFLWPARPATTILELIVLIVSAVEAVVTSEIDADNSIVVVEGTLLVACVTCAEAVAFVAIVLLTDCVVVKFALEDMTENFVFKCFLVAVVNVTTVVSVVFVVDDCTVDIFLVGMSVVIVDDVALDKPLCITFAKVADIAVLDCVLELDVPDVDMGVLVDVSASKDSELVAKVLVYVALAEVVVTAVLDGLL
jgi:hypothetical protein